ncbi:MAG: exosortase/archaeosortase family protein [Armatimonadetes bacterium]|nr:exosortase/archaeosortase family protein [Armatimonadota bacterium]
MKVEKTGALRWSIGDLGKARTWQILGLVSIAAFVFIYWQTFHWWWREWWKDESYYSHGILIPIMSGFVVWFNWKRIVRLAVKPSAWGLALLLPAIAMQFVAYRGGILSVAGLTLPIVLFAAFLLLFGKAVTREMAFPLGFLYFMCVPPTQYLAKLSFKIQVLSTVAATSGLNLLSYDAVRNGTAIHLPNIEVLVGAPCSGFRMLIALLAFVIFFSYMKKGPMWGRLTLIALVIPLSLIANSIRVMMIALVGEHMGEEAMRSFHDYSGYIVLVIAFAILAALSKVVKCQDFKSMPDS